MEVVTDNTSTVDAQIKMPVTAVESNVSNTQIKDTTDDTAKLKKLLYKLWLDYGDSHFFFIGAVVGRITYRKFYLLADEYNLGKDAVDSFLALQLKRLDYKNLRDSDEHFTDVDVDKAINSLKRLTSTIKYIPIVFKLKSMPKYESLQKYFADTSKPLPPLSNLFISQKLTYGLKNCPAITETWTRNYFEENFKIVDGDFDKQVFELMEVRVTEKDGKRYLDLGDLAELEEVIYEEYMPPPKCTKNEFFKGIQFQNRLERIIAQ